MFQKNSSMEYGIIGIGRFGYALAKTLIEAGKEVLVIDCNEDKIKQMRTMTDSAFVVNNLDRETLEETGIQNCDIAVVCIGEKMDVSILTTLHLINMGIPRVISKARSKDQGCILEKIGAEVVYPENDMAIRLANRLVNFKSLDFIELNGDINICEVKATKRIEGISVSEMNIRKKFKLNIIALERENVTIIEISPEFTIKTDDMIVVIGKKKNVNKFEEFLNS